MNQMLQATPGGMEALRQSARRRTLGHAIILSGSGDLMTAARFLAQAMECESEGDVPCGVCGACRKVQEDIHPDVITVVDDEHKMISVDVLRSVRSDAYILPNEGRRKVYLFPDCALLDSRGQNVLLKVVEEGPAHAAFLFCAENSSLLLQTIRSRCTEWRLGDDSGTENSDDAEELCRLLARRDKLAVTTYFTALETKKRKREELQQLLQQCYTFLTAALLTAEGCASGDALSRELSAVLSKKQLNAAAELMNTYSRQLRFNLNAGHVTGALSAALADLL